MRHELNDALQLLAITALILFLVQALARATTAALVGRFGWGAVPWTTGWLGVPVHEFAHLLACWLTLRRVRQVRLFAPDKASGVMGSVTFEPGTGPVAWLAALLIGFAPLLLGTALLWLLGHLAAPIASPWPWIAEISLPIEALIAPAQHTMRVVQACATATLSLWHQGTSSKIAAVSAWYFACCVAAHVTPSRADLRGTWRGGTLLVIATVGAIFALEYFKIAAQLPLARLLTLGCQTALPALLLALLLLAVIRTLIIPFGLLPGFHPKSRA